jgi:hypothetical protein
MCFRNWKRQGSDRENGHGRTDAKEFRDAMRAFAGNCSVITVGEGEEATGLVVTSAISLSAEPPLLLACVNRSASSHPSVRALWPFRLELARRGASAGGGAVFRLWRGQGAARYEGPNGKPPSPARGF